jgi:hypothetical protein
MINFKKIFTAIALLSESKLSGNLENRMKSIIYSSIFISIVFLSNCSILMKKDLPNLEENDWFKLESVHFQVKENIPVWEVGINWKETKISRLRIVDTTHEILIYEGNVPGKLSSVILGSPIRQSDPKYSWIFQEKNKPSQVLIRVNAENNSGESRSAEKTISISPETKYSLYHKTKDL